MISIKLSILCLFVLFMTSAAIPNPQEPNSDELTKLCQTACLKVNSTWDGKWDSEEVSSNDNVYINCICENSKTETVLYSKETIIPRASLDSANQWMDEDDYWWSDQCYFSDFASHAIKVVDVTEFKDCAINCKQEANCTHFDFMVNMCTLMYGVPGGTKDSTIFQCGVRKPVHENISPQPDVYYRWSDHCQFSDSAINSLESIDFKDCEIHCKLDISCTHFHFNNSSRWCTLMNGGPSEIINGVEGYQCGILENDQSDSFDSFSSDGEWTHERGYYQWTDKCFFTDNEIGSVSNADFINCAENCKQNADCTHFDFNINTRWCSLMNGEPINRHQSDSFKCGIPENVQPAFKWSVVDAYWQSDNCYFLDPSMSPFFVNGFEDCAQNCITQKANCTHFHLAYTDWCYLYNGVPGVTYEYENYPAKCGILKPDHISDSLN